MAEVFTAEDVQRLGMSPEMIGTPKQPTFVPADPQAVTIDTIPPEMVYQDPEAGAIPRQTGLTPNYPLRTVASGPPEPAPATAGILQQPTQPTRSDDPFGNLSKQQRMMLAFSAISDAGMAAQGKEGTSFARTLKAFGDISDSQRKREAAAQRQQMLQRVMGGVGGGMGDMSNLELKKQQLIQQAYAFPDMAPAIKMQIDQIDEQIARSRASVSAAGGAGDTLKTVEDLLTTVRNTEGTTGFWGSIFGMVPFTAAGELRIDAQTLRSNMALDALQALKASGATLGAVSNAELDLLESDIAKLNLNQSKEAVLKDLNKIKGRYQKTIRFAYKEPNADIAALDRALGGRPTWLEGDNGSGNGQAAPLTPEELEEKYQ